MKFKKISHPQWDPVATKSCNNICSRYLSSAPFSPLSAPPCSACTAVPGTIRASLRTNPQWLPSPSVISFVAFLEPFLLCPHFGTTLFFFILLCVLSIFVQRPKSQRWLLFQLTIFPLVYAGTQNRCSLKTGFISECPFTKGPGTQ